MEYLRMNTEKAASKFETATFLGGQNKPPVLLGGAEKPSRATNKLGELYAHPKRKPPLCKGRWHAKRDGGVVKG